MESTQTIDTAKVAGRRQLRFNSPQELRADVARLVAADRAGTLKQLGNWPLGQILGHLGGWVDFAFDGNPLNPHCIIKFILRPMKNRFLNKGLPSGKRIPGTKDGTIAVERYSTAEGLARFNKAWERLESQAPTRLNPIFGKLTHDEWKNLHQRHAELHLSFLIPA